MILGLSVVSKQHFAVVTPSDFTCRCALYMSLYSHGRKLNARLHDYYVEFCDLAIKMIPRAGTFIIEGQRRIIVYCLVMNTIRSPLQMCVLTVRSACFSCIVRSSCLPIFLDNMSLGNMYHYFEYRLVSM